MGRLEKISFGRPLAEGCFGEQLVGEPAVTGPRLYRLLRILLTIYLKICHGFSVRRTSELSKAEAFLVVANHTTFLDPIVVGCAMWDRDLWFLARDTLFRGWRNRLLRSVHAMPVHRGGLDRAALEGVVAKLGSRRSVVVFPEGTRSGDGRVHRFRNGFVKMAQDAGVRILPVGISGGFEVWPRQKRVPRPFRRIRVQIGAPIAPGAGSSRPEVAEAVRLQVAELSGQALASESVLERIEEPPVDSTCKAQAPSE